MEGSTRGQVRHGSATTTHAVKAAIQRSQASLAQLSRELGINPKTVAKWRKRATVEDMKTGPTEPRSTVLSEAEEAAVVALRRHALLPLDDCLYALQPSIPPLTRSALHRCLQRHGISRLPDVEGRGEYDTDRLDDIRRLVDAPKSDLFDVLSYVLFANPPKTREDRARAVRQDGMGDFEGEMKELLLGILKAYEVAGEAELAGKKLVQFLTAKYGSVSEGKAKLGELQTIRDAFNRMQQVVYRS